MKLRGPVMAALKEQTRAAHEAVEAFGIPRALVNGQIRHDQYIAMLRAYHAVHRAFASALARYQAPWLSARVDERVAWLERDLAAHAPAIESTSEFATALFAMSFEELVGAAYVLEGAALGNAFLLPRVRAALNLEEDGCHFMRGHGAKVGAEFVAFGAHVEALVTFPSISSAIVGAVAMFELVGLALDEAEASCQELAARSWRPSFRVDLATGGWA